MTNDATSGLIEKTDRLASLIEVNTIINSSLDLNTVIGLVMEKAQEVMHAEASSVLLLNRETNKLEVQSALGRVGEAIKERVTLDLGQGIAGWVAKHQKPLNVANPQKDPRFFKAADEMTGFQTRNILASPLSCKDRLIGVAEVINRKGGRSFSEGDEELFTTFCRSVALAVENARLHLELLENERIHQQLESAQAIQQSFLPQTFPVCPRSRFETWATYRPARSIGGDFYDFLMLDEDHLGIAIGDVSGKGIPAALYMAHVLSDLRFLTSRDINPGASISNLNNQLIRSGKTGVFVTLTYVVMDADSGRITAVNAGHLPMFRIRSSDNSVETMSIAQDIPLGIRPKIAYSEQEYQLEKGDYLVLFTDGITEARNGKGEEMSLEELRRMLRNPWKSPKDLTEQIFNKIQSITSPGDQHDDLTLVAVRWN